MKRKGWLVFPAAVACLALAAGQSAFAFNPIHESSYDVRPNANFRSGTVIQAAGIFDSRHTEAFGLPLSLALKASSRIELGGGLKTAWGDIDEHISYLVFGAKWAALPSTTFQADLLVGAEASRGKGFSLASLHRFSYSSRFYSHLTVRAGFMEALVQNDAFMAFEGGFYPALVLARPLSLQMGLIGSSQTKDFEGHLAIDFQPALQVRFARESMVETAIAFGLAGDHKEEMRVKVAVIHGI
jgi:hypothetical protein